MSSTRRFARTARIWLALLGAVVAGLMAVATPSASAAPWSCDAFGYLFQAPNNTPPGLVQQIDLATGAYSTLGSTTDVVNAVGYNTLDDYFYAWDLTTSTMVRIEDDLTLTPVPTPLGYPGGVIGDFDGAGHYWAWSGTALYEIDYAPGSPTYGQTIHSVPTATPAGLEYGGADWAWIGGSLYRTPTDVSGLTHLVRVNPTTGAQVDLTPGGLGFSVGGIGAVYADANGYLYGSDNSNGAIYRVDPVTHAAIRLPDATGASSNDGARCAEAPIPTVTVEKVVDGRVRPADQFTVALVDPTDRTATSATTSGTATTASTVDWPTTQNATYTITDAMAAGSPTPLSEYIKSIRCVDGAGNPVSTGGTTGRWTLNIAAPTDYVCTVTNKAAADVSVVKTSSKSPVVPGTNQTYTLTVHNNGPSTAVDAKVTDPLPAGLTYVSGDAGCSAAGATITCAAGDLAPGATKSFTVTAKVGSDVPAGNLTNTATATSKTPDPDPSNNTGGHTDPVDPIADLSVVKQATSDKLVPGRELTYRLIVSNDGPSDAKDVKVTDPLPDGLTFVSASNGCAFASGAVTCSASSLGAGKSITYEVVTKVASSVGDTVTNTAKVESATKDPDPSNNSDKEQVPAGPQADLAINKIAGTTDVHPGQQLFYTMLVRNDGPSDAQGVVVTDTAGAGLTLLSANGSQGQCSVTALRVSCSLGTIPAGGTAQIIVSARADQPGQLTNSARVNAKTDDPDPKNNSDDETVTSTPGPVPPPADLEVVKTSNRTSVTGSGTITYKLTVTNHGPGSATGTQVIDTPSLPIAIKSVKSTAGKCSTKVPITCDLGTLAPNAKVIVTVVAQPRAAGTLRNSAIVTGDAPDPKVTNNIDGASTKVQALLKVSKVADRTTVAAGDTLSYRIKVTNASPFAAKSVKVCDDLPSGMVYLSSSPKAKLSGGKRCWTIATLGAKASKVLTIRVRVLSGAAGRTVNVATATAPNARGAKSKAATDRAEVHVRGEQVRGGGVTG